MNTPPSGLQAQCPYCAANISIHQKFRPGHCDNPECSTMHAIQGDKIRQARLLSEYKEDLRIARETFQDDIHAQATAKGISPDRVYIGAVPHIDAPLVPLPDARRQDYLSHLAEITKTAFALPQPAPEDISRDYVSEQSEPNPWNNPACGTCRGFCCHTQGGHAHAFQKVATITEVRKARPDLSADEVIALYEDALPEVSNDGGCVFQGPQGCVLDRSLRSDVCNTFRCYALHRLAEAIDPDTADVIGLVSVSGKKAHRSTVCVKSG